MVLPVDLRHRVADGFIPSDLGTGTPVEIEEERRLLYVAMTNAKDYLHPIELLHAWTERAGGPACLRFKDAFHSGRAVVPFQQDGLAGRVAKAKVCASMPAAACAACGDEEAGLCATCIK